MSPNPKSARKTDDLGLLDAWVGAVHKMLVKLTIDLSKVNKWYLTEILFFSVVLFLL